MNSIIHPVVLCGGSGSRLWPLSTSDRPKQFLALTSTKSMIELTLDRFDKSLCADLSFAHPLVVGAERHEKLLAERLPDAKKILEPLGRNSAPAVAAACLTFQPEDLILILPADHDIQDLQAFHNAISIAAIAAHSGSIVTFGIKPTHPATGYGYIKTRGDDETVKALPVEYFVEKPDSETARSFISAGDYLWNAGIFLFKNKVMIDALQAHAPEVLSGARKSLAGQVGHSIHLDEPEFSATPSISIDFAVLEKVDNVKTVPVDMGWSDVGGYRALHELLTRTHSENYTSGPVHVQNSTGSFIRSEGPRITIDGVSDLVVVATPDEVMITPITNDGAASTLRDAVRTDRTSLGVSLELRMKLRHWLWSAFDHWAKYGWDLDLGGFVEQLYLDGQPDRESPRRIRVQARQIFSYAKSIELGWVNRSLAKSLIERGLAYLDTQVRHPDGGFIHKVAPDGSTVDDRRDLYDHAFIILAGSAAFKSTGDFRALKIAEDALNFIDTNLKDSEFGGWHESVSKDLPRCANPHMHLLEAMLEYHSATGDEKAIAHAAEIVRLFETKFFNPSTDTMTDSFGSDWALLCSEHEAVFEPGHHFEWATLLFQYQELTDHDTESWRRRLIRKADRYGINSSTEFALNAVKSDGTITNNSSRLWLQWERARALLLHYGVTSSSAESVYRSVLEGYLKPGSTGGWIDELDDAGNPMSKPIPASMLYHAVTALMPLITENLDQIKLGQPGF